MKWSLFGDALTAAALALGSFAIQGRIGLNLADEGFLWCGVRDTARGARPIRDVDSYDPGRYWWAAAFARIRKDDGIVTTRLAAATWEALGLFAFLRLARSSGVTRSERIAEALLLQPWMFPLFRSFDHTMPIFSVLAVTRVIERPIPRRAFVAGLNVGITALIGRNHAVYATSALSLALLIPAFGATRWRNIVAASAGVAVGYAPLLFCLASDRRFRTAFVESVGSLLQRQSTNITRPIPWPWTIWPKTYNLIDRTESILFAALPIVYGGATLALLIDVVRARRPDPSRVAALAVGIPYLHYAFSRADIYHLASSIFPLFWFAMRTSVVSRIALTLATVVMSTRMTPFLMRAVSKDAWVAHQVGSDNIQLPSSDAEFLGNASDALDDAGAFGKDVFFAPFFPALYPAFGKRTATYEIYLTLPATEARQLRLIRELEEGGVEFALVRDVALDNNERHRFQNTHRLLWRHILRHFNRVSDARLPSDVLCLRRSGEADPAPSSVRFGDASSDAVAASGFFRGAHDRHVWATSYVMLRLTIPDYATAVTVYGYLPPDIIPLGEQHIDFLIDGIPIRKDAPVPSGIFEMTAALPANLARPASVVLELHFSRSFVPRVVGLGPDDRTVSALLSEIAIR